MGIGTLIKQVDAESVGLHVLTHEELVELQRVLIHMMRDVKDECAKHNIEWSLSGGSVLGCVRDGGFISWDDDLDLFMTRDNYKKFKEIFQEQLSKKYELKKPGDFGYVNHYPQIYKKNTTAQPIQSTDEIKNCVFIDIFILENTYNNRFLQSIHGIRSSVFLFIDSVMRIERCKDNLLKYSVGNEELQKAIKRRLAFSRFFKFRTLEEWLERSDACFSKVKNNYSKMVVVPSGMRHYFKERYDREKMTAVKKEKFSGEEFFIMKDSDYYLTKRYGSDYMTPPQTGQEEKHVFIQFDLNH